MHKKFIVDVVRKKRLKSFCSDNFGKINKPRKCRRKSKEKRETEILFLFKDDKKFFVILNVHIKNRTLFLT